MNLFGLTKVLGTVDTTRINPFSTQYVCTERIFDNQEFVCNKNVLKNLFVIIYCSHIYASFGTFCVQIGQLFTTQ